MSKNSICKIYSYYNILKLYAKAIFVQHWFFNRIYSHTSTAVIDVIIKVELDPHRKMKNGNATNWTNIICSLIYNVKRTFANATELYEYCSKKNEMLWKLFYYWDGKKQSHTVLHQMTKGKRFIVFMSVGVFLSDSIFCGKKGSYVC